MAPTAPTRDQRPATAIEALRSARFHVRRRGYDIGAVDRLLQRCLAGLERLDAELDGGEDGADGVGRARSWDAFWEPGAASSPVDDREVAALIAATSLPSKRKGYDQEEVDALLARLVAILASPVDEAPAPTAPTPAPAPPDAPEPPVAVAPPGPGPAAMPDADPRPMAEAAPATPEDDADPGPDGADDLEGRFVRHVVDASLRSAQRVADAAWIRREAERLLLEVHEANLAQVEHEVERECARLRQAALEQCATIVSEARAEADRTLAAVSARVDQQLAQVRRDALDELERIVADERRGLDDARLAIAPGTAEVGSLPRRPGVGLPPAGPWDRASVERHGDWVQSLYSGERAPVDGGHD